MATTTDQKLTRAEVTTEAVLLGFTEVQTAAGWIPFTDWRPYGTHEPKLIRFYLESDGLGSYVCERQINGMTGVLGCWPIR